MALPLYLAMTAAEICGNTPLPEPLAYMACHFSPYGTGLSNRPKALPQGSMLILNDRTPIHGHDPARIREQLEALVAEVRCGSILLDFQRPGCGETAALISFLQGLPCPVAVSDTYAEGLSCPVFLSPVPLDVPLVEYLRPWQGREVWLEAALDGMEITLTAQGCSFLPLPCPGQAGGFEDDKLHCHHRIHLENNAAKFTLFRTREDLDDLLSEAEALGVARAVGLWQELSFRESSHPDARLPNPG